MLSYGSWWSDVELRSEPIHRLTASALSPVWSQPTRESPVIPPSAIFMQKSSRSSASRAQGSPVASLIHSTSRFTHFRSPLSSSGPTLSYDRYILPSCDCKYSTSGSVSGRLSRSKNVRMGILSSSGLTNALMPLGVTGSSEGISRTESAKLSCVSAVLYGLMGLPMAIARELTHRPSQL